MVIDMDQTVITRLEGVVTRTMGDAHTALSVGDDDDIVNGLGIDSMQMIRLLLEVEATFGVSLDFEQLDLAHLRSVRAFSSFIEGSMKAQGRM